MHSVVQSTRICANISRARLCRNQPSTVEKCAHTDTHKQTHEIRNNQSIKKHTRTYPRIGWTRRCQRPSQAQPSAKDTRGRTALLNQTDREQASEQVTGETQTVSQTQTDARESSVANEYVWWIPPRTGRSTGHARVLRWCGTSQ